MQKAVPPAVVRPIDGWGAFLVISCCVCWGFNQVAVKIAIEGIPPLLQAGLRSVLSGLLVWAWAWSRGVSILNRDGTLLAGLAIGVAFAIDFMLLYPGLKLTTASRGVLFLYAMPFFVAIGAHFLIPGDRLTWSKWFGLIAAFAGLAIALGDGLIEGGAIGTGLIGDLMCIGAAAGWAATTLIIRTSALRFAAAEKILLYQLAVSAPLLLAASVVAGEGPPVLSDPRVLIAFGYTVVLVAFVSYIVWFWLLMRHSASVLSVFTFLTPIFGIMAGALTLGEPLSLRLLIALGLVAAGLVLVNRPPRPEPLKS